MPEDPFSDIGDLLESGDNRQAVRAYGRARAAQRGIDPDFADRLWTRESGYNRNALNKETGAAGIGQMIPGTAKRFGLTNPHDAKEGIDKSLDYLGKLSKQFGGDTRRTAAGYFAGEGQSDRALANPKGNPKTVAYANAVGGPLAGGRSVPRATPKAADPFGDIGDLLEGGDKTFAPTPKARPAASTPHLKLALSHLTDDSGQPIGPASALIAQKLTEETGTRKQEAKAQIRRPQANIAPSTFQADPDAEHQFEMAKTAGDEAEVAKHAAALRAKGYEVGADNDGNPYQKRPESAPAATRLDRTAGGRRKIVAAPTQPAQTPANVRPGVRPLAPEPGYFDQPHMPYSGSPYLDVPLTKIAQAVMGGGGKLVQAAGQMVDDPASIADLLTVEQIGKPLRKLAAKVSGQPEQPGLSDILRGHRLSTTEKAVAPTNPVYRAGSAIEEMSNVGSENEGAPTLNPTKSDFWKQLPRKVGGMVLPVASGPAAPLVMAMQTRADQYKDALNHEATQQQASDAATQGTLLGGAVGMIPGGAAARAPAGVLKTLGREAALGFGMGAGQKTGENVIASTGAGYDPARPTMEGVGHAGLEGALTGPMMALPHAVGAGRSRPRANAEPRTAEPARPDWLPQGPASGEGLPLGAQYPAEGLQRGDIQNRIERNQPLTAESRAFLDTAARQRQATVIQRKIADGKNLTAADRRFLDALGPEPDPLNVPNVTRDPLIAPGNLTRNIGREYPFPARPEADPVTPPGNLTRNVGRDYPAPPPFEPPQSALPPGISRNIGQQFLPRVTEARVSRGEPLTAPESAMAADAQRQAVARRIAEKQRTGKPLTKAEQAMLAGPTEPEAPGTLQAQIDAVKSGGRKAVLVTPGEEVPARHGLSVVDTAVGRFLYDANQTSSRAIRRRVGNNTYHELLGIVEPKSAKTTETVVARSPEGQEQQAAVVSPEKAPEQAAKLQEQFPEATVKTEPAEQVIAGRRTDGTIQPEGSGGDGTRGSTTGAAGSNPPQPRDSATTPSERRTTAGVPPEGIPERRGAIVSETAPTGDVTRDLARKARESDQGRRKAERQRDTDPMTGLLSQRAWEGEVKKDGTVVEEGVKRAVERDPDRAIIRIDLNDFKKVNDTQGHPAGDQVLRDFGQQLREKVPQAQELARVGGDEMDVVVHKNDADAATKIIRDLQVKSGDITVTAAAGHGMTDALADAAATKHKQELRDAGLIGERVATRPKEVAPEPAKLESTTTLPAVVYHGSTSDVRRFDRSADIGFHFGSNDSAISRGRMLGRSPEEWNVRPYRVEVSNPVALRYDPAEWRADEIVDALPPHVKGAVAKHLGIETGDLVDELPEGMRGQEVLRETLQALGYDGISYENSYEGGGKSWVAFEPDQITRYKKPKAAKAPRPPVESGATIPSRGKHADDPIALAVHDKATSLYDAGIDPQRVNKIINNKKALKAWLFEAGAQSPQATKEAHEALRELAAMETSQSGPPNAQPAEREAPNVGRGEQPRVTGTPTVGRTETAGATRPTGPDRSAAEAGGRRMAESTGTAARDVTRKVLERADAEHPGLREQTEKRLTKDGKPPTPEQTALQIGATLKTLELDAAGNKRPAAQHKRFGDIQLIAKTPDGAKILLGKVGEDGQVTYHMAQNPEHELLSNAHLTAKPEDIAKLPTVSWNELGTLGDAHPPTAIIEAMGKKLDLPAKGERAASKEWHKLSDIPDDVAIEHFPEVFRNRVKQDVSDPLWADMALNQMDSKPKSNEPKIITDWRKDVREGGLGANRVDLIAKGMTVAAYDTYRDVKNFGAWSKKMVQDWGAKIKPKLSSLWEAATNGSRKAQARVADWLKTFVRGDSQAGFITVGMATGGRSQPRPNATPAMRAGGKDFGGMDWVRSRLSNLDFVGTYERRGGQLGRQASDLMRQAQVNIETGHQTQQQALPQLRRDMAPIIRQLDANGLPGLAEQMTRHLEQVGGKPQPFQQTAGVLKSAQYNLRLRFSPKSMMINMLQPLTTLWPHVNSVEFARLVAQSHSPAVRKRLAPILGAGATKLGTTATSRIPDPFAKVSEANKVMGYLHGEKEAKRLGLTGQPAERMAMDWAKKVEFDNSKWDAPPIMTGPVASTLLQFKGFTVKNIESIVNDVKMHQTDKMGGYAARAGKRIISQVALGGVRSFPGVKQIGGLVIVGALAKAMTKVGMDEEAANKTAEAIYYGAPALAGEDLSGSLMVIDPPYGDNIYEQLINFGAGPTVSGAARLIQQGQRAYAAHEAGDDDKAMAAVKRGVGAVTPYPKMVESGIAAGKQIAGGEPVKVKAGDKEEELNNFEAIMKSLGFTPTKQTKGYDEKDAYDWQKAMVGHSTSPSNRPRAARR